MPQSEFTQSSSPPLPYVIPPDDGAGTSTPTVEPQSTLSQDQQWLLMIPKFQSTFEKSKDQFLSMQSTGLSVDEALEKWHSDLGDSMQHDLDLLVMFPNFRLDREKYGLTIPNSLSEMESFDDETFNSVKSEYLGSQKTMDTMRLYKEQHPEHLNPQFTPVIRGNKTGGFCNDGTGYTAHSLNVEIDGVPRELRLDGSTQYMNVEA